jgi:hypothetical protein
VRTIWTDVGFIIAVIGAVMIFTLVLLGKADPDDLYLWLGGAGGPLAGRMLGRGAQTRETDK